MPGAKIVPMPLEGQKNGPSQGAAQSQGATLGTTPKGQGKAKGLGKSGKGKGKKGKPDGKGGKGSSKSSKGNGKDKGKSQAK
jgi:hypothetical protein